MGPGKDTQGADDADRYAHLLIISGDFPPTQSPEAAHAYHLAKEFAQRGTKVTVLTTARQVAAVPNGVSVANVMPTWSFRHLPRFAQFLRERRPEAILLVYLDTIYDHHPMITFAPTLARRILPNVRFVTQFENLMMAESDSMVARAVRKVIRDHITGRGTDYHYGTLLRDSHRLIVLAERHAAGLAARDSTFSSRSELIPPAPIMMTCPPGAEERRRARELLGLGDHDFAFCYYGHIYAGKGVETLLRAFASVSARHPEARLVVIGGFAQHTFDSGFAERSRSYESGIRELSRSLGVTAKIVWTGYCPSTEPEGGRYLRACDACVVPFDRGVCLNNSSFGAVAAHGLPIVTTVGAETEGAIVKDGRVLACHPKDAVAMASAMERLVLEPDLRDRLAQGSNALAVQWFDWNVVIQRIQAAFSAA